MRNWHAYLVRLESGFTLLFKFCLEAVSVEKGVAECETFDAYFLAF
jgi:hypothetical protein